jgi:O-antigen/teichoic acid export membrane protein
MGFFPLMSSTTRLIRDSFPVGLTFLLMALFQRVAVLLLGHRGDVREVAWFGAAFSLVSSAGFLATSITVSSFAGLSRAADAGNWVAVTELTRRTLRWIGLVFFPSCLVGGFTAPWIVKLLYPDDFTPAAAAILYLLPGLYISSLNFALKYLLSALQMNWLDTLTVALGLSVLIFGILAAPTNNLLRSAALAWSGGELAILLTRGWLLRCDHRIGVLALPWHLLAAAVLAAALASIH